MSTPAPPRPHRRAATQLLVGLLPLLVTGAVLCVVLAVRLSAALEPLAAATGTVTATVVAVRTAEDLLFGLAATVLAVVVAAVVTGLRVVVRRRLRRAPASAAIATRVVVRQGLVVRSWLEVATGRGVRWLPVHWSPELAALQPDTRIEFRGDVATGRTALPVIDGAEVWPSGRLRTRTPRGERRVVVPADLPDAPVTWSRQVRSDVLITLAAPVLGLLWAFVDGSGTAGFVVATVLAAALLFWLAELLGSDPSPPPRD